MKYTKRLSTLFSELEKCEKFADVGCDHGYCAEFMLERDLCAHAVVSDVSAESLKKAQVLLANYAAAGKVTSVCCDGLEKIPRDCDLVLIAGMGGEEIVTILKNGKNTRKVREYLLSQGMEMIADYTFADGKFYDLIKAEQTGRASAYSEKELEFGRDNLLRPSADFLEKLRTEIEKKKKYLLSPVDGQAREEITLSLERLEEINRETRKYI